MYPQDPLFPAPFTLAFLQNSLESREYSPTLEPSQMPFSLVALPYLPC